MCTCKHWHTSTSKLVISVLRYATYHKPSISYSLSAWWMSLPQVKSISDYSNINVSDIFTISLPLHTQIPLDTEQLRSLVYVSTTSTMHTHWMHVFAMLMKETLIKESSRYTSRGKKKHTNNPQLLFICDLQTVVTLEK